MKVLQNPKFVSVLLFAVSILVFSPTLSIHGVEYRDDEIFYFQSTQEMLAEGNYLSPTYFGENRFQKPILFYWLILVSYKVFGPTWFAARFVAVIFAALSIAFTYLLARLFFSFRISLLSVLILASGSLFLRHAKNAVPDMALNFFILASIYYALVYIEDPQKRAASILFFLMSALGFMTKGIAALVIPFGVVFIYLFCTGRKSFIKEWRWLRGLMIWLLITLPWFIYMNHIHGDEYLKYMLVEETKERIIGENHSNILLIQAGRFMTNLGFYFKTIMMYYLPWSFLVLFSFPAALKNGRENGAQREGVILGFSWVALVVLVFSNMYFTISHYMLVISTPLSILMAWSLVRLMEEKRVKAALGCNIIVIVFLGISLFAFSFLVVFLAGASRIWLAFFLALYVCLWFYIVRTKDTAVSAGLLGLLIIFIFSQSHIMVKAGLASHGTLQNFAATINKNMSEEAVIGVGSYDIHEKEFQLYFDRPLIKAGHSHEPLMVTNLKNLFNHKKEVYCLLTQKDYNDYQDLLGPYKLNVIQKENMVRKRMRLDKGFLAALVTFDQKTVREYLTEPVFLLKKEKHARN